MLTTPPPGYNVNEINAQDINRFSIPGQQGSVAQGYKDPFRSSFSSPSSYAAPSSVPAPQPWYSQQQDDPVAAMLQALRGS